MSTYIYVYIFQEQKFINRLVFSCVSHYCSRGHNWTVAAVLPKKKLFQVGFFFCRPGNFLVAIITCYTVSIVFLFWKQTSLVFGLRQDKFLTLNYKQD